MVATFAFYKSINFFNNFLCAVDFTLSDDGLGSMVAEVPVKFG